MFIPQKDYNFTFCAFIGLVLGALLGNYIYGLIIGGIIGVIIYIASKNSNP